MLNMNRVVKKIVIGFLLVLALMNLIAAFHAYRFTHYSEGLNKTKEPAKLTTGEWLSALVFGIKNPRPENKTLPSCDFKEVAIQSNCTLKAWYILSDLDKGTVILFHGYGGDKSTLLERSEIFHNLGYNTLLVDFMGSGASEGIQTTIGFRESEQVKSTYDYISRCGEDNIILFGTSMGAAAIAKSFHETDLHPSAVILECPYSTLQRTISNRFELMGLPSFPMAGLLAFWGGVLNGFWAFNMNPEKFATDINCPSLLMYGEKDKNVQSDEIEAFYKNIQVEKILCVFPEAGHENYLIKYRNKWIEEVTYFLNKL